ncbi:MAG TPA: hypothetical protein VK917_04215 [Ilumatobacter sp.]|nr:hypothetical protein [Ilumatobacter sp.]
MTAPVTPAPTIATTSAVASATRRGHRERLRVPDGEGSGDDGEVPAAAGSFGVSSTTMG